MWEILVCSSIHWLELNRLRADAGEKFKIGDLTLVCDDVIREGSIQITTLTLGQADVCHAFEDFDTFGCLDRRKAYGSSFLVSWLARSWLAALRLIWFSKVTGVPESTSEVIDFVAMSRAYRNMSRKRSHNLIRPTVVHCSAGIGRSGVFVASDIVMGQVPSHCFYSSDRLDWALPESRLHRRIMSSSPMQRRMCSNSSTVPLDRVRRERLPQESKWVWYTSLRLHPPYHPSSSCSRLRTWLLQKALSLDVWRNKSEDERWAFPSPAHGQSPQQPPPTGTTTITLQTPHAV